jgi:hypothetical protein
LDGQTVHKGEIMPATTISSSSASNIGAAGTIVTTVACDSANGNAFTQDGRTLLRLINTDASTRTVTFTYPLAVDGQTVPSKVVTLGIGEIRYFACGLSANDKLLYPNGIITFTANNALVKWELINYPTS